jgi:peptidoglycan/xylan/chitin deacetylase (PgdA/CDA1 family)
MKSILKHSSDFFPFQLLSKIVRPKLVAPFYHIISSTTPLHLKGLYNVVEPQQFISDLDFLLKNYIPITYQDIPSILKGEKSYSKPAFFLSFDDGFSEIESVVTPILIKKGVPATFFVTPNFVGSNDMLYRLKINLVSQTIKEELRFQVFKKYIFEEKGVIIKNYKCAVEFLFNLNYNESVFIEQIANVVGLNFPEYLKTNKPYLDLNSLLDLESKGFTIGAHSLNHPLFSDLTEGEQIKEVRDSVEWIRKNIPNQPKLFAFPFTDYGISSNLFKYFFTENPNLVDVFFGTAGYKPTNSNRFLHRIPMENSALSAKRIIKGELFYYLAKSFVGKHKAYLPL